MDKLGTAIASFPAFDDADYSDDETDLTECIRKQLARLSESADASAATTTKVLSPITSGAQSPRRGVRLTGTKLGAGCFGDVFEGRMGKQKTRVAVKRVAIDDRYESRERHLHAAVTGGPNIVRLEHHYEQSKHLYLVLEWMPLNLCELIRKCPTGCRLPSADTAVYMQQLARGLAHVHSLDICHRDLKPANILVDPQHKIAKLADFGSAKYLDADERNTTYITTRFYRAPETILDYPYYTTKIDCWSLGCIFGEMLSCKPIFRGTDSLDQLVQIMRNLGTPSPDELLEINPELEDSCVQTYSTMKIPPRSWASIVRNDRVRHGSPTAELLAGLLAWSPTQRLSAAKALKSQYFDAVSKGGKPTRGDR